MDENALDEKALDEKALDENWAHGLNVANLGIFFCGFNLGSLTRPKLIVARCLLEELLEQDFG